MHGYRCHSRTFPYTKKTQIFLVTKQNKVLQNKLFTQSYNSACVELGTVRRNACHSADNSLVFTLAFPVQQYVITLFTKENVYSVTMLFVGSKYILF